MLIFPHKISLNLWVDKSFCSLKNLIGLSKRATLFQGDSHCFKYEIAHQEQFYRQGFKVFEEKLLE